MITREIIINYNSKSSRLETILERMDENFGSLTVSGA